jgi:hypothetical protein
MRCHFSHGKSEIYLLGEIIFIAVHSQLSRQHLDICSHWLSAFSNAELRFSILTELPVVHCFSSYSIYFSKLLKGFMRVAEKK